MVEHRFYPVGQVPPVSTYAYHEHRERAPHLEQDMHRGRLTRVAHLIRSLHPQSVVDLGCGDGGLLSLLQGIDAWGYDFQPSNVPAWEERGVFAVAKDVLWPGAEVRWAELTAMTEVLEHIDDPHRVIKWAAQNSKFVVASSPHCETPEYHAEEHAWGWDMPGYLAMFSPHYEIITHETLSWCQILMGRSKYL
jgi:hypothetical protein